MTTDLNVAERNWRDLNKKWARMGFQFTGGELRGLLLPRPLRSIPLGDTDYEMIPNSIYISILIQD